MTIGICAEVRVFIAKLISEGVVYSELLKVLDFSLQAVGGNKLPINKLLIES